VYSHVPRNVVTDALIHIRDLYRRIRPANDQALRAHALVNSDNRNQSCMTSAGSIAISNPSISFNPFPAIP
jgi:hypothetical protein